jgi:hypothetical protein
MRPLNLKFIVQGRYEDNRWQDISDPFTDLELARDFRQDALRVIKGMNLRIVKRRDDDPLTDQDMKVRD